MRKWAIGAAVLLAVMYWDLWPFPQQDTGDLYLVDALLIESDGTRVRLYAGDVTGTGETVEEAVEQLEENAPGQLFLRQTTRIIFCGGAEERLSLSDLPDQLPMGTYVYRWPLGARALDMETLNPVLEAAERRREDTPTLATVKNDALAGRAPAPMELKQEG